MKYDRAVGLSLSLIIFASLLASFAFVRYELISDEKDWRPVVAELLLVIVLAAEGLFAVYHLRESRDARQAEALRDFMHDFCKPEHLVEREELFILLPWGHRFGEIPNVEIEWLQEKNGDDVSYKMKGNECCEIKVTMGDKQIWRHIQRLSDQYHFAGMSCERGYIKGSDILVWMGPQPLRWWRRLGNLIRQERIRRNPTLFEGFEKLAKTAERHPWPVPLPIVAHKSPP